LPQHFPQVAQTYRKENKAYSPAFARLANKDDL
jgi:hypothetical protein